MEDLKPMENECTDKRASKKTFFSDIAKGYAMGIAFIIPGFSGGSIAAILGFYDKLVGAIADIFKSFKKSVTILFPILFGLALGAVSLLYPLKLALEYFPLPTVSLFVGLAIGGLPSITSKAPGRPSGKNLTALIIPLILALSLSFIPIGAEKDLFNLTIGGYLLLFLVGVIGSSALVVPGISGSMLLLILGYYNPILRVFTDNLLLGKNLLQSILILATAGVGIAVGFFGISVLMKLLLNKYQRGTYFAIIGFIIGSLPTVYISTAKEAGMTLNSLPTDAIHWVACVLLLAMGAVLSLTLVRLSRKNKA